MYHIMLTISQLLEKIEASLQAVPYPERPQGIYEPIE
jgi:hypothetical protein